MTFDGTFTVQPCGCPPKTVTFAQFIRKSSVTGMVFGQCYSYNEESFEVAMKPMWLLKLLYEQQEYYWPLMSSEEFEQLPLAPMPSTWAMSNGPQVAEAYRFDARLLHLLGKVTPKSNDWEGTKDEVLSFLKKAQHEVRLLRHQVAVTTLPGNALEILCDGKTYRPVGNLSMLINWGYPMQFSHRNYRGYKSVVEIVPTISFCKNTGYQEIGYDFYSEHWRTIVDSGRRLVLEVDGYRLEHVAGEPEIIRQQPHLLSALPLVAEQG